MAAGETIALILESGRSHDEDFLEDDIAELSEAVKQLATDSHKYRAKRDRKAQRATFRDVLRYLEVSVVVPPPIKNTAYLFCLTHIYWNRDAHIFTGSLHIIASELKLMLAVFRQALGVIMQFVAHNNATIATYRVHVFAEGRHFAVGGWS